MNTDCHFEMPHKGCKIRRFIVSPERGGKIERPKQIARQIA
jgi:hypothetical protein